MASKTSPHVEAGYASIMDLLHLPRNPKDHDIGEMHVSVDRWGFLERMVVNRPTGHVLSGNGRLILLRQKKASGDSPPRGVVAEDGEWLAPVDWVDLPEEEEEAVALALNELVIRGGYDQNVLAQVLSDRMAMDPSGRGLSGTGFDPERTEAVLSWWRKSLGGGVEGDGGEGREYTADSLAGAADEWVDCRFRLPAGALEVVEGQVDRICGLLGWGPKQRGLALERMAILAATTGDEEIAGE